MNCCSFVPPAARIARRGPSSICSMASANIFEIMPIEWIPIARMPGRVPSENISTNAMASTTSGIERVSTPMKRAMPRQTGPGVVFAAAR